LRLHRAQAESLREQENRLAVEFFGTNQGLIRIVERQLWHEFAAVRGESEPTLLKTSGQFDVALVKPESRRALILDGKSGWLPVPPNPTNLQLRRLATLLCLQLGSDEVGVAILKPFDGVIVVGAFTRRDSPGWWVTKSQATGRKLMRGAMSGGIQSPIRP